MSKPIQKRFISTAVVSTPGQRNALHACIKGAAAFALALLAGTAAANMTVYPMALSVGGDGTASSQIRVYSKSPEIQYVKVSVKKVLAPATEHEREEPVANWDGEGIVVSPQKFALAAGGSRAVRLVNLSTPESEVLYRVYFEPTTAPQDADGAAPDKVEGELSVTLVWGVLVRALPKQLRPAFAVPAPGTHLHNTGNVRISLLELGRCRAGAAQAQDDCEWQKVNKNVYPAQQFALPAAQADQRLRVKYQVEGKQDIQYQDVDALL